MGFNCSKPELTGERVTIWEQYKNAKETGKDKLPTGLNIWHQKGVDGQTYLIHNQNYRTGKYGQGVGTTCKKYEVLSEALEPNQPMGKFLQYGQMTYRNAVQYIDDVKEAQKKIRQLAESNGVDVPYETKEWNPNMMGFGI